MTHSLVPGTHLLLVLGNRASYEDHLPRYIQ
jgi:hypothetical protein